MERRIVRKLYKFQVMDTPQLFAPTEVTEAINAVKPYEELGFLSISQELYNTRYLEIRLSDSYTENWVNTSEGLSYKRTLIFQRYPTFLFT